MREGPIAAGERGREVAEQLSQLGGPGVSWHFEELPGTGGGNFSRAVYRMHFLPSDSTIPTPLSAIVKIVRRQDQDPSDMHYWRREAEAYRSGDLRNLLPDALAMPACYFCSVVPDQCCCDCRRSGGAGETFHLVAAVDQDEGGRAHHLISIHHILVLVGMHGDKSPTVGMFVRKLLEVWTQRATRLTPGSPKIDHDTSRLGE